MDVLAASVMLLLLMLFGSSHEGSDEFKETVVKTAEEQGVDPDNLKPGKLHMVPPMLTPEEEGSYHLPRDYRCDGCLAVAYQFQKGFMAGERRIKKGEHLHHADVLEIVESVCEEGFMNYGLKNVNGKKVLSGEGLKHDQEMGVMEGGGRWAARLTTLCGELVEMYEEEGIYDQYVERENQKLAVTLCTHHCSRDEIEEIMDKKDEL